MNGFNFMDKIKNKIQQLWGNFTNKPEPLPVTARTPAPEEIASSTQDQGAYFQGQNAPTPTPTPTPYPQATEQGVVQGLTDWGGGTAPPVATIAAALAMLGNLLNQQNPKINPYMPTALSLKETGGGRNIDPNQPTGMNNPFGIMSYDEAGNRSLANYPDFETATLGGGTGGPEGQPQQGLQGTLTGGLYDNFLRTGDYSDFFSSYSPTGENASIEDQMATLDILLKLFGK